MKRSWIKIASIYIGTVIGAGFASGREIIEFFGIYGLKGSWGLLISGILFILLGSSLLIKIYNKKIKDLNELLEIIFTKDSRWLIDLLILISLYTGFAIMVAGSGAIFKEQMGKSFNLGLMVMIISCFTVFLFDLEGLSFINVILVPLLIIGILFTAYYIGSQEGYNFSNLQGINLGIKGNFLTSAILYFGSNSLLIIVVFSSLHSLIEDKKTAILGGSLGGLVLYILGLSILHSCFLFYNEVLYAEIPMLKISGFIGPVYGRLYTIILWIAMFTTALANGFGFINKLSRGKNQLLVAIFLSLTSIPLASFGFTNLVSIIYPIFGLVGFVALVLVLVKL